MSYWKEAFWESFGKSYIISGVLATAIWGAIIYLAVAGTDIPEVLVAGGSAIIAWFFGTKIGQQEERTRQRNQIQKK